MQVGQHSPATSCGPCGLPLNGTKLLGGLLGVELCKSGLCHPISLLFMVPSKQTTSTLLLAWCHS